MVRKSYTPEQILSKLREAEILLNQGTTLPVVWKKIGVRSAGCAEIAGSVKRVVVLD